jgi:hypothetical protein
MNYDHLTKKKKELDHYRPLPLPLSAISKNGFAWNSPRPAMRPKAIPSPVEKQPPSSRKASRLAARAFGNISKPQTTPARAML